MGNATGQIWGIEERAAQWPTPLSQWIMLSGLMNVPDEHPSLKKNKIKIKLQHVHTKVKLRK